MKDSL